MTIEQEFQRAQIGEIAIYHERIEMMDGRNRAIHMPPNADKVIVQRLGAKATIIKIKGYIPFQPKQADNQTVRDRINNIRALLTDKETKKFFHPYKISFLVHVTDVRIAINSKKAGHLEVMIEMVVADYQPATIQSPGLFPAASFVWQSIGDVNTDKVGEKVCAADKIQKLRMIDEVSITDTPNNILTKTTFSEDIYRLPPRFRRRLIAKLLDEVRADGDNKKQQFTFTEDLRIRINLIALILDPNYARRVIGTLYNHYVNELTSLIPSTGDPFIDRIIKRNARRRIHALLFSLTAGGLVASKRGNFHSRQNANTWRTQLNKMLLQSEERAAIALHNDPEDKEGIYVSRENDNSAGYKISGASEMIKAISAGRRANEEFLVSEIPKLQLIRQINAKVALPSIVAAYRHANTDLTQAQEISQDSGTVLSIITPPPFNIRVAP